MFKLIALQGEVTTLSRTLLIRPPMQLHLHPTKLFCKALSKVVWRRKTVRCFISDPFRPGVKGNNANESYIMCKTTNRPNTSEAVPIKRMPLKRAATYNEQIQFKSIHSPNRHTCSDIPPALRFSARHLRLLFAGANCRYVLSIKFFPDIFVFRLEASRMQ